MYPNSNDANPEKKIISFTMEEKITICGTCKKRGFNKETGLVCSLTNEKPAYQMSCSDFQRDQNVNIQPRTLSTQPDDLLRGNSYDENNGLGMIIGIGCLILGIVLSIASPNYIFVGMIAFGIIKIVTSSGA